MVRVRGLTIVVEVTFNGMTSTVNLTKNLPTSYKLDDGKTYRLEGDLISPLFSCMEEGRLTKMNTDHAVGFALS
jgi:hypothetical protein